MKINKNMGWLDRLVRVMLAAVIGYLYFSGIVPGILGLILLLLGIILLLTSLVSFCPIYQLFHFSTAKKVS